MFCRQALDVVKGRDEAWRLGENQPCEAVKVPVARRENPDMLLLVLHNSKYVEMI